MSLLDFISTNVTTSAPLTRERLDEAIRQVADFGRPRASDHREQPLQPRRGESEPVAPPKGAACTACLLVGVHAYNCPWH